MSKKLHRNNKDKTKTSTFQEGCNYVSLRRNKDGFSIFVQHGYPGEAVCINGEKATKLFIKRMKEFLNRK